MDSKIAQFALDVLKLAPRYFVALTLISAVFLFSPEAFLKKIGLDQLANDYRPWFGGVFVVSAILWLVDRSIPVLQWIRKIHASRQLRNKQLKKLQSLTEDEKKILRFYVANQTKANILTIGDGVVNGLVSAGVIVRAHTMSVENDRFAYNITEFSWQHLNENKRLLAGSSATRNDQVDTSW